MHVFGIDAGGTKTELLARDPASGVERRYFGPAANVQRVGVDGAADALAGVICEAMGSDPGPLIAFAGVAGAGRAEDQEALTAALRTRLSENAIVGITHDADIALEGAFSGESGIVIIVGTGSVVIGRTSDGRIERAGGWGFLLGDEGSGNAIGIEALRALTVAFDGGPWTPLALRLQRHLDLPDGATLIRRVYREAWPVQRAAPVVCTAAAEGDAEAATLLERQVALLAEQVVRLYVRCASALVPRVAFLGGLAREPAFTACLEHALKATLPHLQIVLPQGSPVEGAWHRALRLRPVS
ncbi:MAG TPA: BadF/BadG/BcrA/BcrD ATPase family protein [Rhodothermales bacterium]|nr:BadF/BadG/BcrA/BcrD ATPase family protein [Rhodothermales bacterium]